MERTFLAIKPDAVQRGLIGEVICKIEKKGFKLVGMKFMQVSKDLAETHYGEHKGKPFFNGLIDYITSAPIVAMVWEGKDVIATMRKVMGATNPMNADVGTIRGDFGIDMGRNIIHGSDSAESAKREIGLFFKEDELLPGWNRDIDCWIYE
ncbi:MAG: nucleoside-diphosphate kinase [Cyanobacteriota bacterium]